MERGRRRWQLVTAKVLNRELEADAWAMFLLSKLGDKDALLAHAEAYPKDSWIFFTVMITLCFERLKACAIGAK